MSHINKKEQKSPAQKSPAQKSPAQNKPLQNKNMPKQVPNKQAHKNQAQLEQLEKVIMSIYLQSTHYDLAHILKTTLPKLCQIDSIDLNWNTNTPATKKRPYTLATYFHYLATRFTNPYCIRFYKKTGILKEQKSFLKQVGGALEIHLHRLEQQNNLKNKKEQWELAFDTITVPICLTDNTNRILRTNKTFRHKTKLSKKQLLHKNYFQAFFGDNVKSPPPLPGEHKKRFTKQTPNNKKEIFELSVQIIAKTKVKNLQLVILTDVTKQTQIEKKIAESAQSAELGIISSSIAHELNNPIAGMNAMLQLLHIKNKNNPAIAQDLKDMNKAGQRCSNIIHQLLTPKE